MERNSFNSLKILFIYVKKLMVIDEKIDEN